MRSRIDPHRQQRLRDAALDPDEGGEDRDPGGEAGDRDRLAPAVGLGAREPVDDREQPGGRRDRAGDVDPGGQVASRLVQEGEPAERRGDREAEVDEHGPAPVQILGEHAAEQQPDRGAGAGDRAVDAERLAALGRVGERGREQRQRRGGEQGAEGSLERPGADEDLEAARGAGERRGAGEPEQADDEGALAAEDVADPPPEQEQAAEGERVGGDHPLAAVVGEAEVGLGRRQGDVDDRRVEDDHQLRQAEDGEDPPAAGSGWLWLPVTYAAPCVSGGSDLNLGATVAHKRREFLRLAMIPV